MQKRLKKQRENFKKAGKKTRKKRETNILSEINKPENIKIFQNNIYIVDSGKIKVYSLHDLNLKKEIGKFGQGPGEFLSYPFVENMGKISFNVWKDYIVIGSRNKVSYFKSSGKLDKEVRINNSMSYHLLPFGRGYAGIRVKKNPDFIYDFNLYDEKGKLSKNLCSYNKNVHMSKEKKGGLRMVFLNRLSKGPEYLIYKGKLYISGEEGFTLVSYDFNGNKAKQIVYNNKREKVSGEDRNKIINIYKNSGGPSFWREAKKIIRIPDFYPEFRTFKIDNDIIYFQTYKKRENSTEFILFSLNGKYLKTVYVPLNYKNFIEPYPYTIHNKYVYTFIENRDGDWGIHKEKIAGF